MFKLRKYLFGNFSKGLCMFAWFCSYISDVKWSVLSICRSMLWLPEDGPCVFHTEIVWHHWHVYAIRGNSWSHRLYILVSFFCSVWRILETYLNKYVVKFVNDEDIFTKQLCKQRCCVIWDVFFGFAMSSHKTLNTGRPLNLLLPFGACMNKLIGLHHVGVALPPGLQASRCLLSQAFSTWVSS